MQEMTMQDIKKRQAFRCLVIIVDSNIREKVTEFLSDSHIPIYFQMHGVGTVSSEFLNLCGLGDTHKSVTLCFISKKQTKLLLAEMNQALQLHKKGTGIAVCIPLNALQGWLYKLLVGNMQEQLEENETEAKKMNESITHAMILVAINQGYSDDVMYTARTAGATGGTILRGLKCSPIEAATHFGLPLQEEQEVIAIVVPKEKRSAIMAAISKEHGISTPAHGITLSLPVDAMIGL